MTTGSADFGAMTSCFLLHTARHVFAKVAAAQPQSTNRALHLPPAAKPAEGDAWLRRPYFPELAGASFFPLGGRLTARSIAERLSSPDVAEKARSGRGEA